MRKLLVASALLLAALAACSNPPHSGTVYSRNYSSSYTYTSLSCMSYRPNGACAFSLPVENYVPAEWELCLKADPGEKSDAKGCREVDEQTYHQYPVGSHYNG